MKKMDGLDQKQAAKNKLMHCSNRLEVTRKAVKPCNVETNRPFSTSKNHLVAQSELGTIQKRMDMLDTLFKNRNRLPVES
jgi:DNA topoisomerase IA